MSATSDASQTKRRIVIVGGGLAGLSAAEALLRHDGDRFFVTLLEAKRTVGGRAGSFVDVSTGETIDYCQHVAMGCCTNLIGLLDRCGLADAMHRYSELEFYHPDHRPSRFAAARFLPPPLHLSAAIGKLRYLTTAQKGKIRRALWRLMRTTSDSLASQTAADWLAQQHQDSETLQGFWDVVLVSALGEHTDAVSMSAARKVFMDGFAAARGASDVLVPTRPLSDLFGRSLSAQIQELGAEIYTGLAVTQLRLERDTIVGVETSSGRRFDVDHLISAVPWHSITRFAANIDSLPLSSFDGIPASPITGLHLWFDREITDRRSAVLVATLSQWLFRQPFPRDPTESGCYYQVVISASARHGFPSKERLVATVVDELKHAFPAARDAKLLRSRIVTDPQSIFSLSPEVDAIRPQSRTALPWFHLAGDWIATGWPATMEGAVISGRMAAASVLQSEGLSGEDGVAIPIDAGLPRGWLARLLIAP